MSERVNCIATGLIMRIDQFMWNRLTILSLLCRFIKVAKFTTEPRCIDLSFAVLWIRRDLFLIRFRIRLQTFRVPNPNHPNHPSQHIYKLIKNQKYNFNFSALSLFPDPDPKQIIPDPDPQHCLFVHSTVLVIQNSDIRPAQLCWSQICKIVFSNSTHADIQCAQ